MNFHEVSVDSINYISYALPSTDSTKVLTLPKRKITIIVVYSTIEHALEAFDLVLATHPVYVHLKLNINPLQ